MGDTRVESDPFRYVRPPEDEGCDEKTKTCGETMSHGNPWHEPDAAQTSQQKPADVAAVAKNMAAPRVPSDATLRAEYEKMSNSDLEKGVSALSKRLTGGVSYAGYAEDSARFTAAERVMSNRNAAEADAKDADAEAWRNPFHVQEHGYGVEAHDAGHKGEHLTLFDGSVKVGTAHTGIQGTVMHLEGKHDFGSFDVSATGGAGSVGSDEGTHNADGSFGFHAGGGATLVGGEGTIHKKGVGSVTFGASGGATAEASIGFKKEGDTIETCGRISLGPVTAGMCIPVIGIKM